MTIGYHTSRCVKYGTEGIKNFFVIFFCIKLYLTIYYTHLLAANGCILLKVGIYVQVEFYFSDANLPSDKFLLKQVKKDKEGFSKCLN